MTIKVTELDDTQGLGYMGVPKYEYEHSLDANRKLVQKIVIKDIKFYNWVDMIPF